MVENPLRVVSARRMSRVRLVMHHALELVGEPILTWADGSRTLWGAAQEDCQCGLRPGPVQLVFRRGDTEERFGLAHQTRETARAWLASRWGRAVVLPSSRLPHHAVRAGGRFPGESRATVQLEQELGGASQTLEALAREAGAAAQVIVSASSFAMTTVLPLRAEGGGAMATVGFSPGDSASDEPYWFVSTSESSCPVRGERGRLHGVGPVDREKAPAAALAVRSFLQAHLAALRDCAAGR